MFSFVLFCFSGKFFLGVVEEMFLEGMEFDCMCGGLFLLL